MTTDMCAAKWRSARMTESTVRCRHLVLRLLLQTVALGLVVIGGLCVSLPRPGRWTIRSKAVVSKSRPDRALPGVGGDHLRLAIGHHFSQLPEARTRHHGCAPQRAPILGSSALSSMLRQACCSALKTPDPALGGRRQVQPDSPAHLAQAGTRTSRLVSPREDTPSGTPGHVW